MKTLQLKSLAKWLPMLLLPLLFAACSDNDEPEVPGEGVVEPITPAQMAYITLTGNYFDIDEPSVGTALDEAKSNERSKVAETVELALEDFERYLPKSKDTEPFIHRSGNTVSVELDTLGSVKFEPASGEGVVARVEVNLKEKQEYTVLYRTKASYSENNSGGTFSRTYYPGDVVEFINFIELEIFDGIRTEGINGMVIEASDDEMYVFTINPLQYELGRYTFHPDAVSLEGWQKIYNAMQKYHDDFMETADIDNGKTCPSADVLRYLFESDYSKRYVCVGGDDLRLITAEISSGSWRCSSYAGRLSFADLARGRFDRTEWVRYANWYNIEDIRCSYCRLIKVDCRNADTLRLIWSSRP